MSATFEIVRRLVESGERRYSAHEVRELAADGLLIGHLVREIASAMVTEDYPD